MKVAKQNKKQLFDVKVKGQCHSDLIFICHSIHKQIMKIVQ